LTEPAGRVELAQQCDFSGISQFLWEFPLNSHFCDRRHGYEFHASHLRGTDPSREFDFPLISISPYSRRIGRAKRSLRPLVARDRLIDPRHQPRTQRAGIGCRYTLSKLLSVFHTKHKCVDIKRQRVAMRQSGRSDANLLGPTSR
jgi:hypothetical protein